MMAPGGIVSNAAAHLIGNARADLGSRTTITQGSVALAEWLATQDPRFLVTDDLHRLLAGVIRPGDAMAEWLGDISSGAVTTAMFDRAYTGEWPFAFAAAESVAEVTAPDATGVLVEIDGPIGTLPLGPVWQAVHGFGNQFALVGPGVALVLDETNAWAMRGALTDGLQALRRHREPGREPGAAS
jgi:hypothetical protein